MSSCRGNHDSLRTQAAVAQNPNAIVLDGDVKVVKGLVLAGVGDPRFTPDTNAPIDPLPSPSVPAKPPPTPTQDAGHVAAGRRPRRPSPSASPRPDWAASSDPEVRAGGRLSDVVQGWNTSHPDAPVAVAAVHEPYAVPPLLGHVPVVLAGHFHSRSVKLDPSGTRIMIEGSTGGAGITSDTMHQVADGTARPTRRDAALHRSGRGAAPVRSSPMTRSPSAASGWRR